MSIDKIREEIDVIDDEIAKLYIRRMAAAREIGIEKAKKNIAAENTEREKSIISRVTKDMPEDIKLYAKQVYNTLFCTSKAYQSRLVSGNSPVKNQIDKALADGVKPFPVSATVACQGVAGAYSQIAADKIFDIADVVYVRDWDAVFNAVEKGLCEFGVLPVENSTAGSVNAVYDLMRKHKFYIARSVKIKIRHCLLAKKGTDIKDITEIFSHEQAIKQCAGLIKSLNGVKITVCDNTALAAKEVSASGRTDVACIASRECAGIYGLSVIRDNVQDSDGNYTRFIAISKQLQIYRNATKISVTVNIPHEAGSLNRILNRFSTLGLNLTKLESRPMGNTPFEFAFYFDFEAGIEMSEVRNLIAELDNTAENFVFMGSYEEIG